MTPLFWHSLKAIALLCILSACVSGKPAGRDLNADQQLGLGQDEAVYEAKDALRDMQEAEREEREQSFRRTVTDPLIEDINP